MSWVLIVILMVPLLTSLVCWWAPALIGQYLTLISGVATFALALALIPTKTVSAFSGWLQVDALSIVFLVTVAFLYGATSVFAIGYVRSSGNKASEGNYNRRLFAGINLFAWSMALATIVNGLALLWVAIEITTVVSALLVAIEGTDGASEAAWKYVLIASIGLGIALFGTIIMYYAGSTVFGSGYELFYSKLLSGASHFPPQVMRLAFVLAVLGYGTKMGLAPLHTWLPDAHSEAPTPVSALLSGALLAVSFYAILRFYQVTERAVGPTFPRDILLAFGLASLGLAALFLSSQEDLKRMFAYSSVEHMGILAIGMSFSAKIAIIGVLLHVLAHAPAKATAFFGAGSAVRKFGSKDMTKMRGGISLLPWSGTMLVLAVLALCAMPPFGIFRSEFLIVSGGLSNSRDFIAAVLIVAVSIASLGLTWFTSQTMITAPSADSVRGEISGWIVASMLIGLAALVVLGIHPPGQLSDLLGRAANELGVGR